MQLLFLLLLAGNLLLTAAVLRQVTHPAPQPPPISQVPEEKRPDPVDEGFENIMRFTVDSHRKGGSFP